MKINILFFGKIMRRGLSLALMMLLLVLTLGVKAGNVDVRRARQVATTFLNINGAQSPQLTDVSASAGFSNVYVFTTENSFVLIAADDCARPILGYSLTGRFDIENMPDNKRAWIEGYSNEIQYAKEHQKRATAEVAQQWRDLVEGNPNSGRAITVVAPLIQTQWNQDWPYNNLCPDGTVTGCSATAMAQVLKYWNYPPTGIGMHSYEWNGQTLSADFGNTTYDWNNMLNTYDSNSTEAQQTAVATLMFHCGVSLNMNYGWAWSGGSSAYSSMTAAAFINYFNYSTETQLRSRSSYSDGDWMNMVKAELNQNRPLWYCGTGDGGGHAFVCDGYNNNNYFHFNWGWGGYCDEYYTLNDLSPGPGGIGSGSIGEFNNNQQALFGAQPSPESAAAAPLITASLITGSGVRNAQLSWNVVDNAVSYNIYRNGSLIHTTSSGNETSYLDVHIDYGTTIYYVRCIDENGILSWPSNYASVTIVFPAPTDLTAEQVGGGVLLSWMPCEGAVSYNVYCNNGILESGINQTSFYDNRSIAGELSYFVKGVDELGDLSESSTPVFISIPFTQPVVGDLQASVSGNTVALSWSEPNWCFPETSSGMLNYGSDNFNGYFGYNSSTYWGHRYPAENLANYSNMSIYKVSLYARVAGEYEVLVYKGTTNGHPQTLVREQSVLIESAGWFDIDLFEKIQIDPSQDYWVFFHDVNGIYCPGAFCYYSGNEGNYYSVNPTSWVSTNSGIAFLIHTYLTDGIYTYNLYRDGSVIANAINATTYIDNNLATGEYNYYVKTNYYAGETSASNQVTVQIGNSNCTQTSSFSQGYNWWCSYVEQSDIDGLVMLEEGLGNNGVTIRSQASGYTDYYQGYGWYGSLSSINNESSYRVITSTPCTVTMTGSPAVPSQHPITVSQGWTWIGYVPSFAMDVNTAMEGMDAMAGDKLKSQQGYADFYPNYGWFGSLNTIEPGMGLMYYSMNDGAATFIYPDSNRGVELKKNLTAEDNHWKPNVYAYPDNMTVMAVVELDDKEPTSDNYELAAFTADGECRGSVKLVYAEPLRRHVAFLTISGKDATELTFRLYDAETGMEYYAEENLDFVADAIVGEATDLYTIHFRGTMGMDELTNKVQVYPNPVIAGEQFSIGMANAEMYPVHVEIVNALGVETLRATSVQTPVNIMAPTTAGVYTLRITVEGKGMAVRKLVVK